MALSLSKVLLSTPMQNARYVKFDLRADTPIAFPRERHAYFHLVVEGAIWITSDEERVPKLLNAGDFALLIHGKSHRISLAEGGWSAPLIHRFDSDVTGEEPQELIVGPRDAISSACVLSGTFGRDQSLDGRAKWELPSIITLPRDSVMAFVGFRDRYEFDKAACGPGAFAFLSTLIRAYYIQAVRTHKSASATEPAEQGLMLDTPLIGLALRLIEAEPQRNWKLTELANMLGMSRTIFSERFSALIGEPPMRYLARMRLETAQKLLAEGHAVNDASWLVGYSSAAAFARAYRKMFGNQPRADRRRK